MSSESGSIISDDVGIAISADASTVAEGAAADTRDLQFTISRTGDLASPVEVDWSAAGMDAADFAPGTSFTGRLSLVLMRQQRQFVLLLKEMQNTKRMKH